MFKFFCFCDSADAWQFGIQDPATPIAVGILKFHNDLIFIFIFIVVFVTWLIFRILVLFNQSKTVKSVPIVHGTSIEIIWTLIPIVILLFIAIPSFSLLYAVDESVNPAITLKVIGNQWFWSYEYSDYFAANDDSLSFDSYLLSDEDLEVGFLRILEVDNRIILPESTHVRLIVTSSDVLHCWTVPSFGVKIDACPGRLNEVSVFVERVGVFYGQCSELCGVNHGIMPIVVEVLSVEDYLLWISESLNE
ncbi:cytochrome c oxidase subunit II [PVC group bacterium (ex Bugula neritina AB1)]|nr:cytochrome c oxidase subunit II [PVC group bacterium (ex Bugula neritina AB1)]